MISLLPTSCDLPCTIPARPTPPTVRPPTVSPGPPSPSLLHPFFPQLGVASVPAAVARGSRQWRSPVAARGGPGPPVPAPRIPASARPAMAWPWRAPRGPLLRQRRSSASLALARPCPPSLGVPPARRDPAAPAPSSRTALARPRPPWRVARPRRPWRSRLPSPARPSPSLLARHARRVRLPRRAPLRGHGAPAHPRCPTPVPAARRGGAARRPAWPRRALSRPPRRALPLPGAAAACRPRRGLELGAACLWHAALSSGCARSASVWPRCRSRHAMRRVRGSAPVCARPVRDASAWPCAYVLAWSAWCFGTAHHALYVLVYP
jgi:hypothetical protein